MYYIYHIPGVKIGCTTEYPKRCLNQGYENYELLETYEDGWIAGDRELKLQAEYGYRIDDCHYMISSQNRVKATNAAKIANLGNTYNVGRPCSEEKRLKISSIKKGIPARKLECPECGRVIGGEGNYNRHIKTHS